MLKVTVTVECDQCRELFDHVTVSTDREPKAWFYMTAEVDRMAESAGWDVYHGHLCQDCLQMTFAYQPTRDQDDGAFSQEF